MKIFDTHCHYNLDAFSNDWEVHWNKAKEHGVIKSTVVGVDIHTSQKAIELAQKDPNLFAVIGCHPGEYQEVIKKMTSDSNQKDVLEKSLQLIKADELTLKSMITKEVTAIGETGLDYFRLPDGVVSNSIKEIQKAAFAFHIQIAESKKLPLIIHARDKNEEAYWDILNLLKKSAFSQSFVLHCVSGPSQYIQEAINMGAYIGVAGNITYKNSEHLRELVAFTPRERILLETDAPFLPPVPYRGQNCEPWMISQTATYLEDSLGIDLSQIYENSLCLFKS